MRVIKLDQANCVCGSSRDYEHCCAMLHNGAPASSAEKLMRSRYSAYALGMNDYLFSTWHHSTRPATAKALIADETQWLSLTIDNCHSVTSHEAFVEFVARYKVRGRAQRLHEISRFVLEQGHWLYVDGIFPA